MANAKKRCRSFSRFRSVIMRSAGLHDECDVYATTHVAVAVRITQQRPISPSRGQGRGRLEDVREGGHGCLARLKAGTGGPERDDEGGLDEAEDDEFSVHRPRNPHGFARATILAPTAPSATIFSTDNLSFTTDNHQSWLSQSPSSQRPLPTPDSNFPPSDFVLFPSPSAHRPAATTTERATANLQISHNRLPSATFDGQHRRNSSTHNSAVQNPRVTEILHGTGQHTSSSTSSHRFSLPSQKPPLYASSSAPSSSAALKQQQLQLLQQQHSGARSNHPLFSSSSADNVRSQLHPSHNQSPSTMSRGMPPPSPSNSALRSAAPEVELNDQTDMALLGLDSANLGRDFVPDEGAFFGPEFTSPQFHPVNDMTASFESTNTGTVSPQDLMRDPHASLPPSSTMTNLTSPSLNDSPDFETYDNSPFVFNADNDVGPDAWFSLFPGTGGERVNSPDLANDLQEATASALASGPPNQRTSPRPSPLVARGKYSPISGVTSRKRDKPLQPITVDDPTDTTKIKRARNTLAARKSRQKKVEKFEELERMIEDLKADRDHWKGLALSRNAE
ncbi:MAG: hypothetical protein M1837_001360 [Sclerophora amabilis]|nr:MAG: hypothetical protein M1837_001360 [Sclerophora amabilis]